MPDPQVDITVTGRLDPRRWTVTLLSVTGDLFSDIFVDIWPGSLTLRNKVGTLTPRRWEGTLI